jgi:hypothetical protein
MSENVDIEVPCPLKDWTLFAKVRVDTARFPDRDSWPVKKVKISICDQKDGNGTTRFSYARVSPSGESKPERLLDGKAKKTVWISAESEEEPWKTAGQIEVSIKSGDKTTVELVLVADGGGLVVEMTRADGKPLKKQLAFSVLAPDAKDNKADQVTTEGRKVYKGLPAGRWRVKVDADQVLQDEGLETLAPARSGEVGVLIGEGKTATVSFMASHYTRAQFVGFEVLPEFKRGPKPKMEKLAYLSDPDNWDDLARRALLMKSAMRKAETLADTKPEVLKIFMAPEFYWRGKDGGYELSSIDSAVEVPTIMAVMREEAKDPKYRDWLFVFGTAIGYLKHGVKGNELTYGLLVKDAATWDNTGSRCSTLNVVVDPALDSKKAAEAAVVTRIPHNAADPIRWTAEQGVLKAGVLKWEKVSDVEYKVFLDKELTFTKTPVVLREPGAVEVFNVAFVQRGGPAGKGLREAVVYKEFISPIDFIGGDVKTFHAAGGKGRQGILGGGVAPVVLLPTAGSTDKLASAPNPDRTEVTTSGLGGGSIFTMDGITFGLEVCLDHAENRLHRHYVKKTLGEPRVQIVLIPSWGMNIAGGAVVGVENGLVFNVDRNKAAAGALDGAGLYKCQIHAGVSANAPGLCPRDDYFICDQHEHFQGPGGACSWCGELVQQRVVKYCNEPHIYPPSILSCPMCAAPTKPFFECPTCKTPEVNAGDCATCAPKVARVPKKYCEEIHEQGAPFLTHCPSLGCGAALQTITHHYCSRHLQLSTSDVPCHGCGQPMQAGHSPLKQKWDPIAAAGAGTAVPDITEKITLRKRDDEKESATNTRTLATRQAEIFQGQSQIVLFPPQDIPQAKVV